MHDERVNFVREVQAGDESVADLCRIYGVSRKTGYKWLERYDREGVAGLADRSRAPRHQPNAVGADEQAAILALRAQRPTWGERKLHAFLQRQQPEHAWPSPSTIGAILKRHGLTYQRRRRRYATPSSTLSDATAPNRVWAIDFKGHFRTGDGVRCDPLTISDTASRYLLRCQAVERPDYQHVRPLLEATFRKYGLPWALRSDNGPPFASVAVGGLSRLSVWFLRLGVRPERIEPGHPEQNGRHERMHRTLKQETARPPKATARGQQRAFARFQCEYNEQRPHEALGMATPASVYVPSEREYPARLPEMEYPDGYERRRVYEHGDIHWSNQAIFLSEVLAGETVGLEQDEQGWRIWFGPVLLARLDREHLLLPRSRGRVRVECLGYSVTHVPGRTISRPLRGDLTSSALSRAVQTAGYVLRLRWGRDTLRLPPELLRREVAKHGQRHKGALALVIGGEADAAQRGVAAENFQDAFETRGAGQ